jgi:hypothetical protein
MPLGPHPLDNAVRASLTGPHAHFAERRGAVLRYPPDVCPFVALPDHPSAADWADAAALAVLAACCHCPASMHGRRPGGKSSA